MEFILNIVSAFLGGTFALFGQWYVFRSERFSTRRNVLYYLLEIYGNMIRIKKIQLMDKSYARALADHGLSSEESENIRGKFMAQVKVEIFNDVFDSLDDLNENYPKIVSDLSKENPILAFYISGHGKSLDKLISYIDSISETIKSESDISEHKQIDAVFESLFHSELIDMVVEDVKDSLLLLSKKISFIEHKRIREVLFKLEDTSNQDNEISEKLKSIFERMESMSTNQALS